MRILYVLEYYYPYIGGSEKLFTNLAEAMAQEGHEVSVLTCQFDPSLAKKEVINDVEVNRLPVRSRYAFTVAALPAIWRLRNSFDFIHTTTYNAAIPSWLGGRLARKKIVLTFHEVWGNLWFSLPFASWLERILYYSFESLVLKLPFDYYVAVSKFTAQRLEESGIKRNRINQIYNGIDYEEMKAFPYLVDQAPPHKLIYFGRLGISKGLDIIFRSLYLLKNNTPGSIVLQLVVPRRPKVMWKKINMLIDQLGIRGIIEFHHELDKDELFTLISKSHLALIPSYSEGFCYSAVEAAAIGIPIAHSNKGALKEVLGKREHNMEATDAQNLAKIIEYELQTPLVEKTISIREWKLQDSIQNYVKLYGQLDAQR